jgi:hypothetical protein
MEKQVGHFLLGFDEATKEAKVAVDHVTKVQTHVSFSTDFDQSRKTDPGLGKDCLDQTLLIFVGGHPREGKFDCSCEVEVGRAFSP